jgi:hypothetical protein
MLWDGDPLIPPFNGDFERKGAEIIWMMGDDERPRWPERVPMHYRVIEQKYVVPLCSPWRLEHALTVAQVHDLQDAVMSRLESFSLYSDTVFAMLTDAALGGLTEEAFSSKWGRLTGGDRLLDMSRQSVKGLVGASRSGRVLELLARRNDANREFAENRLLWLCTALTHGQVSIDEWATTLLCRWFRQDISINELEQFLAIQSALEDTPHYESDSIDLSRQWVERVLAQLVAEPYSPRTNAELFVKMEVEPPSVARDWLVLQR